MISYSSVSMKSYIDNYKVTKKKYMTCNKQSKDKQDNIVEPLGRKDKDIVVDLKFRISPPDKKNSHWCAGALALKYSSY